MGGVWPTLTGNMPEILLIINKLQGIHLLLEWKPFLQKSSHVLFLTSSFTWLPIRGTYELRLPATEHRKGEWKKHRCKLVTYVHIARSIMNMHRVSLCTHSKIYHVHHSWCILFVVFFNVGGVHHLILCCVGFDCSLCINYIAAPVILVHYSNSWLINPISLLRKVC